MQTFEHADAEFALAFDGDHPRVGQLIHGVLLETHAAFEIDQKQLRLARRIRQCDRCDQHVHQIGLARTSLANQQRVMRRADAERQIQHVLRAGLRNGNAHGQRRVALPPIGFFKLRQLQ